jgi:hypothetical protein
MRRRKFQRTLALALVLSAGALSLPRAEAAPPRSGSPRTGQAIQADLFSRSIEVVKNFFGLLKDSPPGPPNGGGNDPYPTNREGTGICPHGKPPYPGGM